MKSKRALSLILTLAMALSLFCIPGLAEHIDYYPDYNKYMCVGDSIASGCGLTKSGEETQFDQNSEHYWLVYGDDYIYHGYGYVPVPNAYHSLVAKELNAELLQCAVSGFRAVEFRYCLDGVYNDFDKTNYWGNTFFDWDGNGFTVSDVDSFIVAAMNYPEKIKEADVLSINLGSNDVFSFSLNALTGALFSSGDSDPRLAEIKAYLDSTGNIGAALGKLVDLYSTMGKLAELVANLTSTMTKAYLQYVENYNAIMKEVYRLNPDITVVNVGVFNPMRYFRLSSELPIDISGIMRPIVNQMNTYLKSLCNKYDNCYYADVTDAETYPMNYNDPLFWEYFTLKVHPNLAGHRYMAQQIINALPKGDPTIVPDPDDPVIPESPYTDVKYGDWCFNDIMYCRENGLMYGVKDDVFGVSNTMTRGMVAAVLYRMAGSPDVSKLYNPFVDVAADKYYTDAVKWAYANMIISGYLDNTFRPNEQITRQQFASMLYRYAYAYAYVRGIDNYESALDAFDDAGSVSSYARNAMGWAVENGIIKGKTATTLDPLGNATRAQCACILARFDRLVKA